MARGWRVFAWVRWVWPCTTSFATPWAGPSICLTLRHTRSFCHTPPITTAKQPQDRLNFAYSDAIASTGGIPVVLPNILIGEDPSALLAKLDGLLLSGGYDCDPCLFGEEKLNESVEIDSRRDDWELPLARAAVERGIPILAICRGIQTLNVAMGGTLYQDLPAQFPTDVDHRQQANRDVATHAIEVDPDSRLATIIGRSMQVNSFHHQSLKRIADGLRVVACAPDGVVEAVEGTGTGFLIGVQFHPEEMVSGSSQAAALFKAFTAAAEQS